MSSIDSPDLVVPSRVIEPRRGWLAINWGEIWRYRELLYFLAWRDVTIRYKQTVLGILWAFIQPFIKLVVFSVIFGGIAKINYEGYPPPIYIFAGLLPWQFFSEALSRSSSSVAGSANLITKVYFPRLIVPLSSVGACLVDFAISFAILFGLMLWYGVPITLSTLAILPLVVLTILAALGTGILLSAFNVTYRDFQYLIPFGIQIWFFLTPVVYPVRVIPQKWQWLIALNPMTGIVDAYRSAILGKPFEWGNLAISLVVAAAVFVAGLFYFRRMESSFADVV
jgi:lipopolysaccharide transport system permease protein